MDSSNVPSLVTVERISLELFAGHGASLLGGSYKKWRLYLTPLGLTV